MHGTPITSGLMNNRFTTANGIFNPMIGQETKQYMGFQNVILHDNEFIMKSLHGCENWLTIM
jgi:hypothetical protein